VTWYILVEEQNNIYRHSYTPDVEAVGIWYLSAGAEEKWKE